MSRSRSLHIFLNCVVLTFLLAPKSVMACAACFGESDSPLAKGMNWGIFTLLIVVGCVLGGFAAFFIYLAKKSSAMSESALSAQMTESTKN